MPFEFFYHSNPGLKTIRIERNDGWSFQNGWHMLFMEKNDEDDAALIKILILY